MSTRKQSGPAEPVTAEDLLDDLRAVMREAEALLHATEGHAGEKVAEARARAAETLGAARERLHDAGERIEARARSAAQSTDTYVRENPWTAVAVAVGVGFLLGVLGRRRD